MVVIIMIMSLELPSELLQGMLLVSAFFSLLHSCILSI